MGNEKLKMGTIILYSIHLLVFVIGYIKYLLNTSFGLGYEVIFNFLEHFAIVGFVFVLVSMGVIFLLFRFYSKNTKRHNSYVVISLIITAFSNILVLFDSSEELVGDFNIMMKYSVVVMFLLCLVNLVNLHGSQRVR